MMFHVFNVKVGKRTAAATENTVCHCALWQTSGACFPEQWLPLGCLFSVLHLAETSSN